MHTKLVRLTAILVGLASATILVVELWPRPALELDIFDVGQGDAIHIRTAAGEDVLIDGGGNDRVIEALGRAMPFTDRTIELVVTTHPDADHLRGLVSVLDRYRVDAVLETSATSDSKLFHSWLGAMAKESPRRIAASPGLVIPLTGATLAVLWPPTDFTSSESNAHSIVLRLDVGEHCAILTGDATQQVEEQLIARGEQLHCDVLKVGHHGSKTSTSPAFVAAVAPQIAVISVGAKNRYGHPHAVILETLAHIPRIWRTDREGSFRWRCNRQARCTVVP